MPEGQVAEKPRKIELPRRGHEICAFLDKVPSLQARQTGDHRTYKNTRNGQIVTILNKRRNLRDTNPAVYFRVRKTLSEWGIF